MITDVTVIHGVRTNLQSLAEKKDETKEKGEKTH
jgi:hypothetical protein